MRDSPNVVQSYNSLVKATKEAPYANAFLRAELRVIFLLAGMSSPTHQQPFGTSFRPGDAAPRSNWKISARFADSFPKARTLETEIRKRQISNH
jgi:hypothetical protein